MDVWVKTKQGVVSNMRKGSIESICIKDGHVSHQDSFDDNTQNKGVIMVSLVGQEQI